MFRKLVLATSCCLISAASYAQSDAPALIRVIRDTGGTASAEPYLQGKIPISVVGMTAVSGQAENWLLEMHDSFGSIEELDKAINAPLPMDSQTWIGSYRPGLSYRPEEAVKALPKARYILSTVYRVRFGGEGEFAELVRQRRARNDFINLNQPEIAYQVVSGLPSGTFVFLTPLNSLRMLDDAVAKTPLFGEGGGRKSSTTVELSQDHMLLRIDPRLSKVSDQFAEADPDFWSVKDQ